MQSPALDHASERALRTATERDIPALAALWAESFPGHRGVDARVRELEQGMPWGSLADCRVVESRGRIVAGLRAYRMEMHFGGRTHATLGLAGVAVAPDSRRRGLGRRICVEAMEEARARGAALSLLYPFRASFYEGLGFTFAGQLEHYRFRTADLEMQPGWEAVERLEANEAAEARALYARVAARSSGMLTRPQSAWRAMLAEPVRLYAFRAGDDAVRGYALVSDGRSERDRRAGTDAEEPGEASATLRVRELVWETDTAYLALLGWIAAQRDQYAFVRYDALPSEAFHDRVPHPRVPGAGRPRGLWFESARILRGPMLRVLRPGALQDGASVDELRVVDADLPMNTGVWRAGKRAAEMVGSDAMSPRDVARAFLASKLPGQPSPPPGWEPVRGAHDFRLLDEF
jgi:predicted N-acetyltransferase YhbS